MSSTRPIGSNPEVATSRDLEAAASALKLARSIVTAGVDRLALISIDGNLDDYSSLAYDIAHSAAELEIAAKTIEYGAKGPAEAAIACAFAAHAVAAIAGRVFGREIDFDIDPGWHTPVVKFLNDWRSPRVVGMLAEEPGDRHLDESLQLVASTFRLFAEDRIAPHAQRIHRENLDIPETIISGLSELGGFGISVPESHGGSASGGLADYLGMLIATEELSRVSLGAGGSLITRPEILAKALAVGGTDEQRARWLPIIACGEKMVAVSVTEPDCGSDVANLRVSANSLHGGFVINGVKTWCTFAARAELLMVLARTEPDPALGHRGLSMFVIEKERCDSRGFRAYQRDDAGGRPLDLPEGRLEGRPIDTIGYRGMHSYEVSFDNWWVPAENLVGGVAGRGRGFYYQMASFENGRIQTAARAVGVMQAAYEAGVAYARERTLFGRLLIDFELTREKLGKIAAIIQASRQYMYHVATLIASGSGATEASIAKAYACRAAEWVTREVMQLHGGMGYSEEFPASRYFVDARVLSIFEGADETLCVRVIARHLVDETRAAATSRSN